jgi:hypothetical protein
MEARFGAEFGDVRVHADSHAAESARRLHALAYTVGRDVFFAAGRYQPARRDGRHLLAHELAHVIQQSGAPNVTAASTIRPAHDASEREADRAARAVVSGGSMSRSERQADESGALQGGEPTGLGQQLHAVEPGIQRLSINHCTPLNEGNLTDALLQAHTDLSVAIQGILSSGGDHAFLQLVTHYFGTNAWGQVAEGLQSILNGLSDVTIECENPGNPGYSFFCDPLIAYVRIFPYVSDWQREIHLCQPSFHNLSVTKRARVLVHEAAHRFVPAPGDVYYGLNDCRENAATRGLSDAERLANADCYACLVSGSGIGMAPGTPPAPVPAGGGP